MSSTVSPRLNHFRRSSNLRRLTSISESPEQRYDDFRLNLGEEAPLEDVVIPVVFHTPVRRVRDSWRSKPEKWVKNKGHCPSCGLLDAKILCIATSGQTSAARPSGLRSTRTPGPQLPTYTTNAADWSSSDSQASSSSSSRPSSPTSSHSEDSIDGDRDDLTDIEPPSLAPTEAERESINHVHSSTIPLHLSSLPQIIAFLNPEKTDSVLRTCGFVLLVSILLATSGADEFL
ncbi:hypothetical protein PM082_004986 [Marasmius tenuissimus]|nr:hypothetical protein PM082_004986 [Marasmius tenuissimus]